MTLVLAALFGIVIGLTIGALGGGGSILTVPVLVYAIGSQRPGVDDGQPGHRRDHGAGGRGGHARAGRTRWGSGAALALAGVPASFLGSHLNRQVDPNVLLLSFAALMLVAAAGMLLRARPSSAVPAAAAGGSGGAPRRADRVGVGVRLVLAGLVVGFLTGFLGVGGGFVIVPALVVALRMPMPVAVGTSLLVISLNSGVALVARVGHGTFAWHVIVPFTVAAVLGSFGGKRVADRLPAATLSRAFAVLLVLVAGYVAVQAGLGLG